MNTMYDMMVDSMGASLTKRLLRKNAKAVLMSITIAGGGAAAGGGDGSGIWKASTHEDPAVAQEKEKEIQNILQQERGRQEVERELGMTKDLNLSSDEFQGREFLQMYMKL